MPEVLYIFNANFICMEPEVRAFLIRILNTISMVLLWMIVNLVAGVKYNLAFFEGTPAWYHYLYYVFFIVSLALLIRYLYKKWMVSKDTYS